MNSTERKRIWRLANPERAREGERLRAQRRRDAGRPVMGQPQHVGSYQRYEWNLAPNGEPWPPAQELARFRRKVGRFHAREREYMKRLQLQIDAAEVKLARWGLNIESTVEDIVRSLRTHP
jgi:hypothetical protein